MQMRGVLSVLIVASTIVLSVGEGTLQLSLSTDNAAILEREIILHCRYLSSNTGQDNNMMLNPGDGVDGNEMMQTTDGTEQQLSGDYPQFELNNSIIYPNSTLLHNFSVGRDHMMEYIASFQLNPYNLFFGNFTCRRNCTTVSNNVFLAYVPFNVSLPPEQTPEAIIGMGISLSIVIAVTVMLCIALIVTCYKIQQSEADSQNSHLKYEMSRDCCQGSPDPQSSLNGSNSSFIQFTANGYAVPRCTLAQLASGNEVGKQNFSNTKLNSLSKRNIVKVLKYLLHPSDCSNPNCLCNEVKKEYFALLNEMKPPNDDLYPPHESELPRGTQAEQEALQERGQTCSFVTEETHCSSLTTSKDNSNCSSYCKDGCSLAPSLSSIHYPRLSPATSPVLEMSHVDPVDRVTFDSKGGRYFNQDHGIGLNIPPGAVPEGDHVTIEIGASLSCPITFPSGTRPVSPMLSVCVVDNPNYQFLKPVKLRLPHCLDITTKEDVTDLEVRFLKSAHNLFCFHEAKGKFTFQPGTHCGILNTTHFCCFCIGANKKKADLTRISYRLIKVVPNCKTTSSLRWKAHYCITYFLPTCLRALEKQYCPSEHTIQSLQRFKFANCTSSDLPYVAVGFERRVVGGWNLALESPDKIYAKDIDFWEIEPSELEQMESEKLYPPRFVIDVCGTQALNTSQVWVYFSGMTNEFKSELILDTSRGLPQHNFSISSPLADVRTLPYSHSTPQLASFNQCQPYYWTTPPQCHDYPTSVSQHSHGSTTSGSVRSLESTGTGSPSDKDLMNKIAAVIPTKWRHVGLQLGLDQAQLDTIEQKYSFSRDSLACFGEVFMEWKKRMTSPLSWSTVISALKCPLVGENTLAHNLQMELDASNESNSKYSME